MIDLGRPANGLAFIRRVETAEQYPGSRIVITPQTRDKIAACQFVVEAVGADEVCEDEDCERPHWYDWEDPTETQTHRGGVAVGDWILARHRSWEATPDPAIFVIRQADIIGKFVEAAQGRRGK